MSKYTRASNAEFAGFPKMPKLPPRIGKGVGRVGRVAGEGLNALGTLSMVGSIPMMFQNPQQQQQPPAEQQQQVDPNAPKKKVVNKNGQAYNLNSYGDYEYV